MRRLRAIAIASAIVILAVPAHSAAPLPAFLQVLGNVTTSARPVGNALVVALNLSNLEATQTYSGSDGAFSLPQLPAGVYKVIAMKYGFAPAMTTIVPTQQQHRLKLRLQTEQQAKSTNQEMWEIRASLPPDVLREIDLVMAPPPTPMASSSSSYEMPRFKGEMVSMTGMGVQPTSTGFAQTALGVEGRFGDNWQVGFHGNLHRVDDGSDSTTFGTPVAEASSMQMELRSSPTDSYRLASTKSWWRYRADLDLPPEAQQADIRSHKLEWEHGDSHVVVRYLAQQNLFAATPGSDLIEVAGNTTVLQTRRTGIDVALRVTQESLRAAPNTTSTNPIFRTADVTANAKFEVVPSFTVDYGMSSRVGIYGAEWAPRSGFDVKIGKETDFVVTGMYKVYDQTRSNVLPSVVVWTDDSRLLPHYAYSFGVVSGDDPRNRFSAIASVSAADTPLRVVFTDGFENFWDGLAIDAGDVRRDLRVAYRKEIGKSILVDVSSSAGTATPSHPVIGGVEKTYVTGDVESTFFPTRTTLAVSYRQIHQPQNGGGAAYRTQRVDFRVAQSLHLPLDLKLLIGLEIAHAMNSPVLLDTLEPDGASRKYVGGLAVNF